MKKKNTTRGIKTANDSEQEINGILTPFRVKKSGAELENKKMNGILTPFRVKKSGAELENEEMNGILTPFGVKKSGAELENGFKVFASCSPSKKAANNGSREKVTITVII